MLRRPRAPTTAFALPKQRAKNTSARDQRAEQPRTPGAFANEIKYHDDNLQSPGWNLAKESIRHPLQR